MARTVARTILAIFRGETAVRAKARTKFTGGTTPGGSNPQNGMRQRTRQKVTPPPPAGFAFFAVRAEHQSGGPAPRGPAGTEHPPPKPAGPARAGQRVRSPAGASRAQNPEKTGGVPRAKTQNCLTSFGWAGRRFGGPNSEKPLGRTRMRPVKWDRIR